jgi:acetoin utilization deacetylase AcuC-like enzyme
VSGASAVSVWTDARMEQPGHPERPERLQAARAALEGHAAVRWKTPRPASPERIAAVHDPDYVAAVIATRGQPVRLDGDTATSAGSVDAALLAAGAVCDAVDAAIDGDALRSLALVRPPGHHAERAAAMGFCLFNNVAVAAQHALARGVERVLIVDWDVHHGNGTQHLFAERPEVLFFSVHRGFGFYPGTGSAAERGAGNVVNRPLRPGAGGEEMLAAFHGELVPRADAFRPGLVLVSAGFDAHRDDPLGGLQATEETFGAMCEVVVGIAERHAGGKLVLALEGGYDLGAVGRSVRAVVDVLASPRIGPLDTARPA